MFPVVGLLFAYSDKRKLFAHFEFIEGDFFRGKSPLGACGGRTSVTVQFYSSRQAIDIAYLSSTDGCSLIGRCVTSAARAARPTTRAARRGAPRRHARPEPAQGWQGHAVRRCRPCRRDPLRTSATIQTCIAWEGRTRAAPVRTVDHAGARGDACTRAALATHRGVTANGLGRRRGRGRNLSAGVCPCGHTNVVRFAVRMGPYRHTATRLCGRHLCGRSRWSR
jgi:hypothetical protein